MESDRLFFFFGGGGGDTNEQHPWATLLLNPLELMTYPRPSKFRCVFKISFCESFHTLSLEVFSTFFFKQLQFLMDVLVFLLNSFCPLLDV